VLHTHQTWVTALNLLKDNRVVPASQTAALFHDLIAYDDNYAGTADSLDEGERLAAIMRGKPIVFMKNHGVLVTGRTVAQAYRRLYRLERVCRNQLLAMATGQPLETLSEAVIAQVLSPMRG
jgi:ribulose-5-phosphate 4-epimerase/fuculose-1-phosphate aldolase